MSNKKYNRNKTLSKHNQNNIAKNNPVSESVIEQKATVAMRREVFSGPLPHPSILAEYENICSGSADRIITQFEKQTEHRHSLENKFLNQRASESTLGTICITLITISLIIGSIYLLNSNKNIGGFVTLFTSIAPIAFGYVRHKQISKQNLNPENK